MGSIVGQPSYANLAMIRAAGDLPATPETDPAIVRALDRASRFIESDLCAGRRFYPITETRTMDFGAPNGLQPNAIKLWLNAGDQLNEATAITALSVAGTALASYRLMPHDGPPYRWVEPLESGGETFEHGTNGHQDAVSLTGTFGYTDDTETAGTLAAAVSDTTTTAVTLSDGSKIDAGDAVLIGSEWMIVDSIGWVDTTEDLTAALAADLSDTTIAVSDGADYTIGERLLVGSERMLIVDIAGNNLVVRRRLDGTDVGAHAIGASIFARRAATVQRGQLGSSAATHSLADVINRLTPPADIVSHCIAETLVMLAQENAAYARTIGNGENEREARGVGLADARKIIRRDYMPVLVYATGGAG